MITGHHSIGTILQRRLDYRLVPSPPYVYACVYVQRPARSPTGACKALWLCESSPRRWTEQTTGNFLPLPLLFFSFLFASVRCFSPPPRPPGRWLYIGKCLAFVVGVDFWVLVLYPSLRLFRSVRSGDVELFRFCCYGCGSHISFWGLGECCFNFFGCGCRFDLMWCFVFVLFCFANCCCGGLGVPFVFGPFTGCGMDGHREGRFGVAV